MPWTASPFCTPFTLQFTALFELPVTVMVGVNFWVWPAARVALVGESVIVTAGAVSVTAAIAVFVVSAWAIAVIVTVVALGSTFGAVYKPVVLIVPLIASPPVALFTCQVIAVLVDPVTVAVNCCVAPPATLADVGEMVMETPVLGGLFLPPHEDQIKVAEIIMKNRIRFIERSDLWVLIDS